MNERIELMYLHKQLVKGGFYFVARILLQHLAGIKDNAAVVQFVLSIYK